MEFQVKQKYEVVQMSNEEKLDLQSFDDELRTGTLKVIETVMVEGPSINTLVTFMEGSSKVSNNVVSQWKKHKSKKFTETDHTLVKDYLQYTSNILNFCSDLTKFLRAARERHSRIEHMTSMWTNNMKSEDFKVILEELKNLKDSEAYNMSCKNLLTKLSHFKNQQENMITNLKTQMELQSKEKKTDGHGWRHKVLRVMHAMGCFADFLIVTIWEVIKKAVPYDSIWELIEKAVPKDIATLFASVAGLVKGYDWVNSILEELKKKVPSTQMQTLMKVDILVSAELQDIEILIKDMVAESDNIHENVEYATDRGNVGLAMKDMPYKLDMFLKKIKEFEGRLEECKSKLHEVRDEMKSTLQFKNKDSCSIL